MSLKKQAWVDWVGSLYANRIFMCFCIKSSIGTRVKLASCKSALNPPVVYSTDRSKAVVQVLALLFVALWFILRGDLLYIFPCVILFLCFSVLLVLRLPRLGKRELILVLFVRLFDLCLFGFVDFLFLLGSGKAAVCDCGTPWTFLLFFLYRKAVQLSLSYITNPVTLRLVNENNGYSLNCVNWDYIRQDGNKLVFEKKNSREWFSLLNAAQMLW